LYGDLVHTAAFSLNSSCFALTDIIHPVFDAYLWVDTEQDVDGATLLYSVDGGFSWVNVSNISGFDEYWNWYTGKPVSALGSDGWSGQTGGWMRVRHLLPQELTGYGDVKFRLDFMADNYNNDFDGIAMDDVKIFEAPHDAGVVSILDPVSDCELAPNQRFTLAVKNYGIRDMQAGDSILIGYHIDRSGELQTAEEVVILTGTFPAGATMDFNLSTEFDFSVGGEYHVDVYTIEKDPFFYNSVANDLFSEIIEVEKPVFSLGPDIYTVRPDTVVLNAWAGSDGLDYLWQDNSTDSVYYVSTEGTYSVKVTNHLGCYATDEIDIHRLIVDVGVKEIISPVSSCELGTALPVTISIENFGTDTLTINDTILVFGELNQSVYFHDTLFLAENFYPGTILDFTYSQEFDFSFPGIYHLKLYTMIRDDNNASNDTLDFDLHVFGYPEIDLGPDREIYAPEYILDPGPGFAEYMWQDGSQEREFVVRQPGQGMYHVHVTDVNSCSASDTVSITLNVLDIAIDQILSPEPSSCVLSDNLAVSLRIINAGNLSLQSGGKIGIGYTVDGGSLVEKEITLAEDLLPGQTIDYEFSETAAVEPGNWYDFSVFINYPGDMRNWNDTVIMPVGVFEAPRVDLGPAYQVINALEHILDAGEGFESYLWQDGSTNQTYTVNKPGIDTYSVTVTDHNGCTAYEQIQVLLVIPDIGVKEIMHPETACMLGDLERIEVAIKNYGNSNISASADIKVVFSVNGAAPVVEDVILGTTFGAGEVIYHTFAGTSNFSIPGDYSISAYTIYASDLVPSNDSVTANIEILGEPLVDIGGGQDTLVVFDQTVLSATPGYASYLWQDGSTVNTYNIDEPGAGLYRVRVTDDNGCHVSDSVYVAYDVPDIGLNRIVAPVSSCHLSDAETISVEIVNNGFYRIPGSESISISYSIDDEATVTEVRALGSTLHPESMMILNFDTKYNFTGTGSYGITVAIDFEGDQDPANDEMSAEIEVWGYPVVDIGEGNDTINTTLPVVLDAGEGFFSYSWQDNSSLSTYNVTEYGLYWVTVSNEFGCYTSDTVYIDSTVGTGKPIIQTGQISVYPNPVRDVLNVSIETEVSRDYTIELFSIQNRLVYKEVFKNTTAVEEKIHVDQFAPGTYLLRIITDNNLVTYKVIVL